MHVITKYDIPLSDFDCIPANTKLKVIESWNEHEGFIAVRYRGGNLYFNSLYLEEIPALVEMM